MKFLWHMHPLKSYSTFSSLKRKKHWTLGEEMVFNNIELNFSHFFSLLFFSTTFMRKTYICSTFQTNLFKLIRTKKVKVTYLVWVQHHPLVQVPMLVLAEQECIGAF
jgi:hypothetical protein